ncbi:hypothetical protein [Thermus sp.]|uniref:hypothetical protein n=1 Tax=Thermus sp. TaxID=275 RepID=UPI00298F398D|nr:hypothetical protein [Thermus sp.]MDW8358091.1 hypothetical protein [Thermus sp.]
MNRTELAVRWSLEDLERAARYMVKSGLFGLRSPEEAVALMLLAQAEGLHPAQAVREYHVIDGRPALRADAMLARFLAAGGRVEWHELSDQKAEATFSHPQGGTVRLSWTIEDARRAGLLERKGSNWLRYPRAMLRARVISEGVRTVYPGVAVGVYTPEEVVEMAQEVPPPREPLEAKPEPTKALESPSEDKPKRERIRGLLKALGLSKEEARQLASLVVEREVASFGDLEPLEVDLLVAELERLVAQFEEDGVPVPDRAEVVRAYLQEGKLPHREEVGV